MPKVLVMLEKIKFYISGVHDIMMQETICMMWSI